MSPVAQAIILSLGTFPVLWILHWLTEPVREGGPRRWTAIKERYFVMSNEEEDEEADLVPVPALYEGGTNQLAPDTNAANTGTTDRTGTAPKISRRMTDSDIIAVLTVQRTTDKNGKDKERFSANQIADLVGGTRADVLAQVRAIRNLPQFPELAPEQIEARRELGLQN